MREVFRLTLPDGSQETWSYDGNGGVTPYNNGVNGGVGNLYDDAGRQTRVDYTVDGDTTFAYDAAGRIASKAGRNWYSYCGNNSLAWADPQGLDRIIVRGNDEDVLLSGLGYELWKPAKGPYETELAKPKRDQLILLLMNASDEDEFFFWGHGSSRGSILINDTEELTQADLDYIQAERRRLGKGRLRHVHLAACNQAQRGESVNNWLELTEELVAHPGLTGEAWPPRINRPRRFRQPLKPGPTSGSEGKKKKA